MIDEFKVEDLSQLILSQDLSKFKMFCDQHHNLLSLLEENEQYFTLFYQKSIDNWITIDMIKYLQEMNSMIFNNQNINFHLKILIKNDCITIFTYLLKLFESQVTITNWGEYIQLSCEYLSLSIWQYLLLHTVTNQSLIISSNYLDRVKVFCLDKLLESWWDDLGKFNDNSIINIQKDIYYQMIGLLFLNLQKSIIKDYLKTLIYNKNFKNNNYNNKVTQFKVKKISENL